MLTVKIKTDNPAFVNDRRADEKERQCAQILRRVASMLEDGDRAGILHDENGNRVGTFKLTNR